MRTVYATTPHRLRRRKSRRGPIVSWCPWVASPCVRVKNNLRLIDAVGAHALPPAFARLRRGRQSSPLQQGERPDKSEGIQIDKPTNTTPPGESDHLCLVMAGEKGAL